MAFKMTEPRVKMPSFSRYLESSISHLATRSMTSLSVAVIFLRASSGSSAAAQMSRMQRRSITSITPLLVARSQSWVFCMNSGSSA